MDGTLIDSEPLWWAAERELVEMGDGTWTDADALALVGSDLANAARVLIAHGAPLSVPEIVDFLNLRVSAGLQREIPWRKHGSQTLVRMADLGLTCALVTMSHTPVVDGFINAIAPGTFAAVITGDKVAKGKPDPEPYLHAARMLGVEITDCIAVEDSVTGITSAYASGARTIGIKAVTEVPVWSGLSRVASLDQITPAVLDIIMSGGTVDLLGPNA